MTIKKVQSICVVGAGQMGHQIGMLGALAGFNKILQAVNIEALQKAESTLHTIMDKWVNKGMVSEDTKEAAFSRLTFSTDLKGKGWYEYNKEDVKG